MPLLRSRGKERCSELSDMPFQFRLAVVRVIGEAFPRETTIRPIGFQNAAAFLGTNVRREPQVHADQLLDVFRQTGSSAFEAFRIQRRRLGESPAVWASAEATPVSGDSFPLPQ
jgi:hypothetical protein